MFKLCRGISIIANGNKGPKLKEMWNLSYIQNNYHSIDDDSMEMDIFHSHTHLHYTFKLTKLQQMSILSLSLTLVLDQTIYG